MPAGWSRPEPCATSSTGRSIPTPPGCCARRHGSVRRAVDGVSFDLRAGETLGLVGESGCGKSTLGRAVLRLLPEVGGRVVWLGQDLAKLPGEKLRQKRREMQIIFQD